MKETTTKIHAGIAEHDGNANSVYRPMFSDPGTSLRATTQSFIKSTSYEDLANRQSSASAATSPGYYYSERSESTDFSSPYTMSPWKRSPRQPQHDKLTSSASIHNHEVPQCNAGLVGSLVREEGHIYSLATVDDLLYTGSDSKNIRVWREQEEYSGFKSASGLVKSIVIADDRRIFTGHQDGKVRVWRVSNKDARIHKRVGTMPRLKDLFKSSMKPSNYVTRQNRHSSGVWIKHSDAVSCLCLNEDQTLLYSGSWDRTFKVWRLEDLRCIESVNAHDDAVNAVVASSSFKGLVFTGSADGTVKVWKREQSMVTVKHGMKPKTFHKHVASSTLLKQEMAVTALVVNESACMLYGGSSDGTVRWWDRSSVTSGVGGGVLRGHKVSVLCLASSGNLLFSGSADNCICVWRRDPGGHVCLSVLTGHAGPVKCLAVGADVDGRFVLYSGSLDKSVNVWKIGEVEEDRNLTIEEAADDRRRGRSSPECRRQIEVGNFDDTY